MPLSAPLGPEGHLPKHPVNRRPSRLLTLVLATALLAFGACAPVNPDSLRLDPGRSTTFQTRTDYQLVFARASAGFLKCLTGASFRMTFAIKPRIDMKARTASILFVHHGAWTDYWALVDITAATDGTTVKVNANSVSGLGDLGGTVERWAGGDSQCPDAKHLTEQFPLQE
jgi:hypothetical protein